MNDAQLLQSFAEQKSEAAFRTLVERHLPLVFGTARRMTGDNALAEDIAQTVFILLARKANRLGRDVILSGWLYRSTRFVTSRALTAERRRRRREQEAVTMQPSISSEPAWLRFGPQLDDALARLGDIDRNAILLRYFEQQSLRDVGLSLGLNEEAAKKRVARALEKLKRMLSRRGVEISAVALAAGLTKETAEAANVLPLAGKISAVVFAHGAAGAGAASGSALLTNVLAALRRAKIINATAAVVALIVMAILLPKAARYWQRPAISSAAVAESSAPAHQPEPKTPANLFAAKLGKSAGSIRTMVVTVLDEKTGEPIRNATLTPYVDGPEVTEFKGPFHTGSDGTAKLPIPINLPGRERDDYCEIPVNAPDYATRVMRWSSTTGMVLNIVSSQHTVRLSRGITLSGVAVDDTGKPLAGIRISAIGNNCNGGTTTRTSDGHWTPAVHQEDYSLYYLSMEASKVVTDAGGRFKLEQYPDEVRALEIDLLGLGGALHKFQTPEGFSIHAEDLPKVSLSELKNGTARLIIPQGVTVQGIVVDNTGVPIAGAEVVEAAQRGNLQVLSKNRTDASGHFSLSNRPTHEVILGASADGSASLSTIVSIQPDMEPVRLQLPPELPLRGQVVNEAGLPVPNAKVEFVDYLNPTQCQNWLDETGTDGRFEWTDAPTNEMALMVSASGYANRIIRLRASTNESLIVLRLGKNDAVHITGQVTDADSGAPVEYFQIKVSHRMMVGDIQGPTQNFDGANGEMNVKLMRKDFPIGMMEGWIMTIEADGYDEALSRSYELEEGDQQLDFKMTRGGTVAGVVHTPTGEPAVGARLAFGVRNQGPILSSKPGELGSGLLMNGSDAIGQFTAKKPALARNLVVFHDAGWAVTPIIAGPQKADITLSAWGRIEGSVTIGNEPASGRKIELENLRQNFLDPLVIFYSTTSDDNGHFAFDKVPAGIFKVSCAAGRWGVATLQTSVTIAAGETKSVELADSGKTVSAQLQAPPGFATINWSNAQAILNADVQIPPEPTRGEFITDEALEAARIRYDRDPVVLAALGRQRTFAGSVDTDGTVVFQQVPPGNYFLEVKLFDPSRLPPPPNFNNDPAVILARLRAAVAVPETPDTSNNAAPTMLGDFALEAP